MWAKALKRKYFDIDGPHNAFGDPVGLGDQECGCRVTMEITNHQSPITNRPMYFLYLIK
jgi:hypothetical protein